MVRGMGGTEFAEAQKICCHISSGAVVDAGIGPMGTCKMLCINLARNSCVDHMQIEVVDPNKYMLQNKISL
jgi:hypothetical protein